MAGNNDSRRISERLILRALETAPKTPSELVRITGLSDSVVRKRIAKLKAHGLIRCVLESTFNTGALYVAIGSIATEEDEEVAELERKRAEARTWPIRRHPFDVAFFGPAQLGAA